MPYVAPKKSSALIFAVARAPTSIENIETLARQFGAYVAFVQKQGDELERVRIDGLSNDIENNRDFWEKVEECGLRWEQAPL